LSVSERRSKIQIIYDKVIKELLANGVFDGATQTEMFSLLQVVDMAIAA